MALWLYANECFKYSISHNDLQCILLFNVFHVELCIPCVKWSKWIVFFCKKYLIIMYFQENVCTWADWLFCGKRKYTKKQWNVLGPGVILYRHLGKWIRKIKRKKENTYNVSTPSFLVTTHHLITFLHTLPKIKKITDILLTTFTIRQRLSSSWRHLKPHHVYSMFLKSSLSTLLLLLLSSSSSSSIFVFSSLSLTALSLSPAQMVT